MRPIPDKMKKTLLSPARRVCIYTRPDAPNMACSGRIELEHAFIYAGRQINHPKLILDCCTAHNHAGAMVKDYNQYVALVRLTEEELSEICRLYPRKDWRQLKKYLINKYAHSEKT